MLVLPSVKTRRQTNRQTNRETVAENLKQFYDQPGVHGLHFRSLQGAELVLYVTLSSDDVPVCWTVH